MATVIDDVYSSLRALGGQATVREMAAHVAGHEPDDLELHRISKAVMRMARQHYLVAVGVKVEREGHVTRVWEEAE